MRRVLPLTLTVACLLALTACGGNGAERDASADPTLPETSSASTAAPTTTAGPSRSPRGNIVKALGEEGGMFGSEDTSSPLVFTFTVDAITVDQPCNSGFAHPPTNGHYIGISVRASTSHDLPPDFFIQINPDYFKVIGADGVTKDSLGGDAWSCLAERDQFTLDLLGPGQQYSGMVVIDSPVTSGVLIYSPPGSTTGWEWQF